MRRQPLVLLLVTLATVAIANVASELGKPVSRALSDGERDGRSARPSRNKEEERMGAETTATWAEHVFKMLRLHKVNQLFERRRFLLWVQYMKLFHPKNPERAMLFTLYSVHDDKVVAAMIMDAKQGWKTKMLATKLQREQLQLWKRQNKSPADVFEWLKLDNKKAEDLDPLINIPEFYTWMRYLYRIMEKPEDVRKMMAQTLTTQYTDQGLTLMLTASKKKEYLKKLARVLQLGQLEMWQINGKSPDDKYLQLISNPKNVEWVMVQTLTTRYNDQPLAQLLLRSKYKHGDLTSMRQLAAALQETQLAMWLTKGVTPETASSWLVLEGERRGKDEETLLKAYREAYDIKYGKKKPVET
ncbi:hypothetical protein PsorP6_015615 [Peronosclerospora sorghi]|uniref:Uncharacterized protein n=1 Tax=Peronosclerospora sorghi TaxID=230839 RepID=A0ACC0WNE6_9STRA|nr:hypothetical protein PsorP6_015615 [Peronosclerospora sorghi]